MMLRSLLLGGAIVVLVTAGIVTAGVIADNDDAPAADRCASAPSPERCHYQARMAAYCAEHPRDERCAEAEPARRPRAK